MENMTKDAVSVFQRYKELMTYEPTRPDKKYKFNPSKFKHNILYQDYVKRIGFDEEELDDEDFDETEDLWN